MLVLISYLKRKQNYLAAREMSEKIRESNFQVKILLEIALFSDFLAHQCADCKFLK